jgi:hypothetical protein
MLAIVVMSALAVGVETSSTPEAPFVPRAVIYAYPSSSLAMLGTRIFDTNAASTFYAALGTGLRFGERGVLEVELAGGMMNSRGFGKPGWLLSAGVGPSLQLTGDEPFRGLFVSMRFAFHAFRPPEGAILFNGEDVNHGPVDLGPGIARAFMGEVDVGYHFRVGRLYFAPIIGLGVGYAYDDVDPTGFGFWQPLSDASSALRRPQHVVWSLNLNLARLGAAL